ncbi:arsenic transporter [Mycolicibacterium sp. P1-18]|uniref:SLC13 family permease n=1 Tax=Mycolicibacterium sp. P1-18 TaxID=2024615 RepID=UPI0011F21A80|nr:SLC13 family permease [Mycolicibacterium sp. P1-18]KAA0092779.1 arsenic transporter [Mycolicibacterium sp. P1-18]
MTGVWAETAALVALAAVLVFAMVQPRGLPEATLAVPVAAILVLCGVVTPGAALEQVKLLGPTVGFLAAILVLAHLADEEGVFRWLGAALARASGDSSRRLLALVFVSASVTTAVLSLDATVVLLTPVVLATARLVRVRARPHVYACAHLSNSASTLLPVSNLTNLLAFSASGLTFVSFAAVMALPWLVVVGLEYAVFRVFFRKDLGAEPDPAEHIADEATSDQPTPVYAFVVLGLTLVGFGASGFAGVEPVWVAVVGAVALAVPGVRRRSVTASTIVRAASPLFCLFVFALGVVVAGVSEHGLGEAVARALPTAPTLVGLLVVAGVSAVLANVVNNLPATLLMLTALGTGAPPGLVLAMLVGVNIGPNLTYVGSLATLLWRRVLSGAGVRPRLQDFTLLGLATVPVCIVGAVVALWAGLELGLT